MPLATQGHWSGVASHLVTQHPGDYADGLAKGNVVVPLISETLGGIASHAATCLLRLHRSAAPTANADSTRYGLSRSATTSFYTHHLRLLSLSAQVENAALILAGADRENRRCIPHSPIPPPAPQGLRA